ncbi:MAG: hypothetical protein HGB11_01195 [Chlorobiales bacterium]|nr:hypothetical protein [Chlorobiales bacterium]
MKKNFCSVVALLLFLNLPFSNVKADEKFIAFDLTADAIISPGYNDAFTKKYAGSSGGIGWLGVGAGVKLLFSEEFNLTTGADFLISYVKFGTSSSEVSNLYLNYIILPKMVGRYLFTELPSIFVQAELNYNVPITGIESITFESGGVGAGGMLGYEFKGNWGVEAGYLYIPVDMVSQAGKDSVNMGGFVLRVGRSF